MLNVAVLLYCIGNRDKENIPKHVQYRLTPPTHPQLAEFVDMEPTNRDSQLYLSISGKIALLQLDTYTKVLPITMNFDGDSM